MNTNFGGAHFFTPWPMSILLFFSGAASAQTVPAIEVIQTSATDTQFTAMIAGADAAAEDGTFPASTSSDMHGKGGVFTDLDRDDHPDLYLTRGHSYDEDTTDAANALWLYNPSTGGWDLVNGGAENQGAAVGAIAADFDNDGDIDLYVVNYNEPNVLLRNYGGGVPQFVDVTDQTADPIGPGPQFGVGSAVHNGVVLDATFTAAWADFDRDGDLDLFVSSFDAIIGVRAESFHKPPGAGERSTLYLSQFKEGGVSSEGVPRFRDVTMAAGGDFFDEAGDALPSVGDASERIASPGVTAGSDDLGRHNTPTDYFNGHMASIVADLNNDQWPDIVAVSSVADPSANRVHLYRNRGMEGGTWAGFELETFDGAQVSPAGVFGSQVFAPMGITVGDYDNDEHLDMFTTSINGGKNDVLTNTSDDSTFSFEHQDALETFGTAWGAEWLDVNNDRMLDLVVATQGNTTGAPSEEVDEVPLHDWLFTNNGINENSGEREFVEDGLDSGLTRASQGAAQKSLGLMVADFDRDGFVDILSRGFGSGDADQLWRNVSAEGEMADPPGDSNSNNWLAITLVGDPDTLGPDGLFSTRDAIGARVKAVASSPSEPQPIFAQIREVRSGGSNAASTSSLTLHFGLGAADGASIEIAWPSGRTQSAFLNANTFYVVEESTGRGDLNCDNQVNEQDVQLMLANMGPCPVAPSVCPADLNQDGVVDSTDMEILLAELNP